MEIRRLPADEDAVRRFVDELWLPYHRELETIVDRHALADGVDLVAEETAFRVDLLAAESYRAWVAVDGRREGAGGDAADAGATGDDAAGDGDLAAGDGELAGFVTTDVDEAPTVFDHPDRLVVGDVYVRERYRGSGLARDLIDRAAERARETGCTELTLDVDADNERALAFYRKLGFETRRRQLSVAVDGS